MKYKNNYKIDGRFWFTNNGKYFAGSGRIELLKNIKETGSISKAAKVMGMSYKAAWDSVDVMNKITGASLVSRVSGGKNGGGSVLTDEGIKFIEQYEKYEKLFDEFLLLIDENGDIENIKNSLTLKSSADNCFSGKVKSINEGAVNAVVEVYVSNFKIYASVSKTSLEKMELKIDDNVDVLIKSSDIILSMEDNINLSCRNCFGGVVSAVKNGAVNSEVYINLEENYKLCVMVTNDSVKSLNISYGTNLKAYCKASSVLLIKRI